MELLEGVEGAIAALLNPLAYDFFRHALAVGAIIGILCPVVGCFPLVLRISLIGDAIAHAVIPGLAIAHVLGMDLALGAFVSGVGSTAAIAWIQRQSHIRADSAMTLMFATFFALGMTLISLWQVPIDLEGFLFGDLLSVQPIDIGRSAIAAALLLGAIALHYKELLFYTFDPIGAEAAGLPVQALHYGLMAGLTVAIILALKLVGVVLAVALTIGPALTASLIVRELHWMMALGGGFGLLAAILGLYGSFYWDLPSGAAIALASFGLFMATLLIDQGHQGWQRRRSRRAPPRIDDRG